jgi:hypothetical protein
VPYGYNTVAEAEAELVLVRAEMRGPETVEYADRRLTRRSLADLMKREQFLLSVIASFETGRPRQSLGVSSKGFGCLA